MRARFQSGVWALHSFRLLISASMISIFGSLITSTAFPFIAIHELDAGPAELALLSLAGIVPSIVLGSVAGIWIDRISRRRVMIASDLLSAAALLTIPIAYWLDALSLAQLLAVTFVTSVGRLCFRIADRSFLPQVVGRAHVEEANATLSGGSALAEAGGFSAGGLLVQLLTGPVALVFDALSFIGSALLLRKIPDRAAPLDLEGPVDARHWRSELAEGLGFLRRSTTLLPLAASLFLMSIGIEAIGTVYFLFVNEELGFPVGALGFIFATGGIGSLIGAAMSTRVTARFGAGPALIGSLVILAIGQGSIALATSVGLFAVVVMLGQQLTDAFWLYYESTSMSLRQLNAPEAMLGRINGAFESLEFVGLLLGAGLGALLGEFVGLRATLVTGSALLAVAGLPLLLSPVRETREVTVAEVSSVAG
ncbi:MAG TPA: MFS transporter [Thermomicrobiales bacterium]|nr:MFS transporter [Thermomicrobiales bacterium]